MSLLRVCAMREDRKTVLERLQQLGALELKVEETPEEGFFRLDKEAEAQVFERSAATANQALAALDEVDPQKKGMLESFRGKRRLSAADYQQVAAESAAVMQDCARLLELRRQLQELAAERVRLGAALAQLEPWLSLDLPLRFAGTQTTGALIGAVPAVYTAEQLTAAIAERDAALLFEIELIGEPEGQTCLFLICPRSQLSQAEQVLRALGFARPAGLGDGLPEEQRQKLAGRQEALEQQRETLLLEMTALAPRRTAIENTADYFLVRAEKYRAISGLDHSRHTFVVTGYVPAPRLDGVIAELEALCPLAAEAGAADPEEAPVLLENRMLAAPAESIVEMYAMPGPGDIDPTPLMSFFFYLFFGMMFSDAAYGLLLIFGTWWLQKTYRPDPPMAANLRLFRNCGVSTFLWGLVFGSFFGDAPAVIVNHYFGTNWKMPALIDPINDAMTLMVISIVFGLVQIMTGIGAKFYVLWKNGDRTGAVFDCGFWLLLLTGVALLAAGMVAQPVLQTVGIGLMIASAVGLVLTQGRDKKGPMKLLSGFASLYDVTGYVSDLMSYTRLLALGLTTGVMGQVFNTLSTMFGTGIVSIIPMLLVFLVGHAINFGLNALGAYVHTIRLQYVEMFSKFYEGGGRKFRPFAFHSEYTTLQEERKS